MYGGGLVAKLCPTLVTPWMTRLLCPWGLLGKNTRVGCHFLLQYISIHRHIYSFWSRILILSS